MWNFPQVQKQVFGLLLAVPLLLVSITCLGQWLSRAGYRRNSECLPSYYKVYKRRRDSASPLLGSVVVPSATSKYETMELYEGDLPKRKVTVTRCKHTVAPARPVWGLLPRHDRASGRCRLALDPAVRPFPLPSTGRCGWWPTQTFAA
ncbi:hypothetical protein F5141DRAFT_1069380 [Pisolithus sp. B1]|nr:hypothetical protein F5141DRAFT_1069380 [Pisolithus sp. B1]